MITAIFRIVAAGLCAFAQLTGRTYREVNILVYYFMVPFSWLVMLDQIFGFHYFKISFLLVCLGFYLGCRDFKSYSDWLFEKSVVFLSLFNKMGSNYVTSSVWICVALPVLTYLTLGYFIIVR